MLKRAIFIIEDTSSNISPSFYIELESCLMINDLYFIINTLYKKDKLKELLKISVKFDNIDIIKKEYF